MKKNILLFISSIIICSCGSIEKYNQAVTQLHPVEDLHDDIDAVYKQLKRNHPHLYQYTPQETLDFKFDSLKSAIRTPMDSRAFYKQLAQVTKYVGQGHMSIAPPNTKFNKQEEKEFKDMRFDINYLDFEYIDNKLIIVDVLNKDSVLINAEVLKIENETPQDLIKEYKRTIASDGYNTTFHNRVAGKRFMRYYTRDKGRLDSISFTLKNADSTFIKKYKREKIKKPLKDSLTTDSLVKDTTPIIKLTRAEKKVKKKEAKKLYKHNSKYGRIPVPHLKDVDIYTRNLNFVGKDSTVALIKIRGFTNGNYKAFYDEAFTTLDSLKTENLIIDVRNNFGGRLAEIDYLYSYLTDQKYTLINISESKTRTPFLKSLMSNSKSAGTKIIAGLLSPIIAPAEFLRSSKNDGKLQYKLKSAKEKDPKSLNFKGKIYVLINGNSFSASSVLSTQLDGDNRATFVGEETGGAYNGTVAGMMKIYTLPNTKIKASIGLLHIDSKHKTPIDGYGVKPDVEILPTYEDRLNHIDPELQWVLKDIEKTE